MLSTVTAQSFIGQGLSCVCHKNIIGGDEYSEFFSFEQLLDGLLKRGCIKQSVVEAAKAEFQFFVREQRQLEQHSTRKRSDMGHNLSF